MELTMAKTDYTQLFKQFKSTSLVSEHFVRRGCLYQ